MKMNKLLSLSIALFAGIVLFAPSHTLAAAFGVSPPWIESDNLKPGDNLVYVINLSANDLSESMMVISDFEGDPEITEWLTIRDMDNLVVSTGQNITPMSVDVNIPANAKVGKYQGSLRLSLAPESGNSENLSVLLGSNIAIDLVVVDYDVTDYWIKSISADPINEGQAVSLKIGIKNLGNTIVDSVLTKVSVVDRKTGAEVASGSVDSLNVPVYPHTMVNSELSFLAPDLEAGDYWLNVESFKSGKSIYENRLPFVVGPSLVNNSVKTSVEVTEEGKLRAAAPTGQNANGASVKTSVTVRAPLTDNLIVVVIGLLLVLTVVVGRFYARFNKKHRR